MKATPDDPRLSAYLQGELSADEAEEIRRQVAADPALRMSLDQLERTTAFLDGAFSAADELRLLPAQRESIRRAARELDSRGNVVELPLMKSRRKPWIAGLGAAAAVAIAALVMSRFGPGTGGGFTDDPVLISDEVALLPMPGPSAGGVPTRVASRGNAPEEQVRQLDDQPGEYLSEVARHWEKSPLPKAASYPATAKLGEFDEGPVTRLPLLVGRSSLAWITGWVREKGELPPRDAVRVEELVNQAVLSAADEVGPIKLAIESMKCPWDPESILVGVQIEGGEDVTEGLKLMLRSAAQRRVLGSFPVRDDGKLATGLPAGHRTLVMLELREVESGLGGIELHHGSSVSMHPVPPAANLSTGLRHAAVLAGFGLWLRDEGVDAGQLAGMLAEAGVDADPVRAEVRRMIGEALKLAETKR